MKKKFTMLFAALLLCVGAAWAQPETGKMYRIKDDTRSKYLTIRSYNGNSSGQYGTVPVLEKTVGNKDQVWLLEDAGNSNYYLRSLSGYYLVCRGWCVDASNTGGKSAVSLEAKDLSFLIKNSNSYFKVEDIGADSGTAHPFCDAPSGHGNIVTWTFEEVAEDEFAGQIDVTYEYRIGGKTYTTSVLQQVKNSEVAAPVLPFLTITGTEGTIGEESCTIIVNCTENLPFAVSADLGNPVWQLVEMHRYGSVFRVWNYEGEGKPVAVIDLAANKEDVLEDAKMWAFTGNLIDGFKIYNKAAGTSVTLNATATTPMVGVSENGNDVWKLAANTGETNAHACFTQDNTNYMNHQGAQIKYHNAADNGSTTYFYALTSLPQFVIEIADNILNTPEGAVGAYILDDEVLAELAEKTEVAKAAQTDIEKAKELVAAVKAAKNSEQVAYADGYYRIYSAQPGLYANQKSVIYNTFNNNFEWGSLDGYGVNAIVKLSTVDEKVVLQNVNSNRYMQGVAGASNVSVGDNSGVTLVALGCAQYKLRFGNGVMHANQHGNGTGTGAGVISYDGGFGSASAWYLFPVTELEISINEFASICLPFDVEVEGAQAYAVTATSADAATLTAKVDIPAGQGAILEGNGTVKLNLIEEAASDWTGNMLVGTTVDTYVQGTAYVLAKKNEEIGLYRAMLNKDGNGAEGTTHFKNNANKAYLVANSNAPMFSLDRGEGTTGIENSELKIENSAVIYDLAGRRVEKMEKGIYIVNGKKVVK